MELGPFRWVGAGGEPTWEGHAPTAAMDHFRGRAEGAEESRYMCAGKEEGGVVA